MFCNKCGNKLDDDANFCIKCGNKASKPIRVNSLNCPNCGAKTENEDGLDTMFCKYCGTRMMISGMSIQAYNARVQLDANRLRHEENMKVNEYNYQLQKNNDIYSNYGKAMGWLVIMFIVLGALVAMIYYLGI